MSMQALNLLQCVCDKFKGERDGPELIEKYLKIILVNCHLVATITILKRYHAFKAKRFSGKQTQKLLTSVNNRFRWLLSVWHCSIRREQLRYEKYCLCGRPSRRSRKRLWWHTRFTVSKRVQCYDYLSHHRRSRDTW